MLSLPAYAVDWNDFAYINEDGVRVIDVDQYDAAVAEEKVLAAGLDLDVDAFWTCDGTGELIFDNEAFEIAYAAALAELEEQQEEQEEVIEDDPVIDDGFSYPAGSIIDEAGNVFSPDGELLSPGTTPAAESGADDPDADPLLDAEDPTEELGEDLIPTVYTVSDLRSGAPVSYADETGLKGLIISIFGEYTPVMTTMAVTETVDNVTTTTLVDAVAGGAAGVDYEWCSGVFLFGILLFCFMKLLGGLLK